MAMTQYLGTGRRKKSVARVRLLPGTGNITINKRDIDDYFGLETLKMIVRAPLVLTDTLGKYDVRVNVYGGGTTGQAGAIRHGISRAMLVAQPELRGVLKKAGYLTRDPRMKERKNTVSMQPVVRRSSPRDNRFQLFSKGPSIQSDRRFFLLCRGFPQALYSARSCPHNGCEHTAAPFPL